MHLTHLIAATAIAIGGAMSTANADPSFWKFEWPNTDFENTTVENWVEILLGGNLVRWAAKRRHSGP
jgi:hypothetical protein